MAIWSWVTHRTDAVGWESWAHVARVAGLSDDDTAELREVDNLYVLSARKRRALARALCTSVGRLRRIDAGELLDVPIDDDLLRGWNAARYAGEVVEPADDERERPRETPVLGHVSRAGTFEPDYLDPLPREYGATGACFALRHFMGDQHLIFRLASPENWREGEDVAVYLADEGHEGRGYVGRVHLVENRVELQLRDNNRQPIDVSRVRRKARWIADDPAPLNAMPSTAFPVVSQVPAPPPKAGLTNLEVFAILIHGSRTKEPPVPEHPYEELDKA